VIERHRLADGARYLRSAYLLLTSVYFPTD